MRANGLVDPYQLASTQPFKCYDRATKNACSEFADVVIRAASFGSFDADRVENLLWPLAFALWPRVRLSSLFSIHFQDPTRAKADEVIIAADGYLGSLQLATGRPGASKQGEAVDSCVWQLFVIFH